MRIALTSITLVTGVVLALVTYFFLTAPLGLSTHEGFSNPRLQFSALFFVLGVMLIFVSAVVYELIPDPEKG